MKSGTQEINIQEQATLAQEHTDYPVSFFIEGNMMTDEIGVIYYKPHQIEIKSYFRLNGNALPQDNGMVYLIETIDGRKGTLVYKFDAFTDSKVFNFLKGYVYSKNKNIYPD